jgi:hypothetical protein
MERPGKRKKLKSRIKHVVADEEKQEADGQHCAAPTKLRKEKKSKKVKKVGASTIDKKRKHKAAEGEAAEQSKRTKVEAAALEADRPPSAGSAQRKSPRLAAQAAAEEPLEFDLGEDVTGKAAAGAASAIVDDVAQGSPLHEFEMLESTQAILRTRGIEVLFPIQVATYAKVLAGGDMIGRAKTGQGKTLAFVLPIVQRLLSAEQLLVAGRAPRVLVRSSARVDPLLNLPVCPSCYTREHRLQFNAPCAWGSPAVPTRSQCASRHTTPLKNPTTCRCLRRRVSWRSRWPSSLR